MSLIPIIIWHDEALLTEKESTENDLERVIADFEECKSNLSEKEKQLKESIENLSLLMEEKDLLEKQLSDTEETVEEFQVRTVYNVLFSLQTLPPSILCW